MGVSVEIAGAIANFRPVEHKSNARTELGTVSTDEGVRLNVVHGLFNYRTRFESDPKQPLLDRWTTQPVIALVDAKGGVFPLPYAADVNRLPESLVQQVADRLAIGPKR